MTPTPTARNDKVKFSKHDFTTFDGVDPDEWIDRCTSHFEMCETSYDMKKIQAVVNFRGKAMEWYRGYRRRHDHPDWDFLVKLGFKKSSVLSAFDELMQLYQSGTVEAYMEKFEIVRSRMELESPHWPESE